MTEDQGSATVDNNKKYSATQCKVLRRVNRIKNIYHVAFHPSMVPARERRKERARKTVKNIRSTLARFQVSFHAPVPAEERCVCTL